MEQTAKREKVEVIPLPVQVDGEYVFGFSCSRCFHDYTQTSILKPLTILSTCPRCGNNKNYKVSRNGC